MTFDESKRRETVSRNYIEECLQKAYISFVALLLIHIINHDIHTS